MQPTNQPVPTPGPSQALGSTSGANTIRNNGSVFAQATRSLTGGTTGASGFYFSSEMGNPLAKGVRLFTTASGPATGTVTVKIQVIDPCLGTWIDLAGAATAALDGTGATGGKLLTVYPGLTGIADSAGVTINQHIGPRWRVGLTVALADVQCSVGADYLL